MGWDRGSGEAVASDADAGGMKARLTKGILLLAKLTITLEKKVALATVRQTSIAIGWTFPLPLGNPIIDLDALA